MAQAFVFEESDAPAVTVVIGAPATLGKTREAEHHIGRHIAVHAQQLAHCQFSPTPCCPRGVERMRQAASMARAQSPASITKVSSNAASRAALLPGRVRLSPSAAIRHSPT